MTRTIPTPDFRFVACAGAALLLLLAAAQPAQAAKRVGNDDKFDVTLRIIEASGSSGKKVIDPKLKDMAKDLRSMPFANFVQRDRSSLVLDKNAKVSLQFPGANKDKPRFLKLSALGKQPNGKLRFALSIAELKFNTLIAIRDGGTVVYVGPRHNKSNLIFVLTARTHRGKKPKR